MLERCRTTNPVWCVAFAFALSTAAARWVSHVNPAFHYNLRGIHIHHYMYGIFMITVAGYIGLVFKGPKATFWIALLYGWGAGFTFDEMGMWLNAGISPTTRWDRDGLAIGILALVLAGLLSIYLRKRSQRRLAQPVPVPERTPARLETGTAGVVALPQED
jgi:hypothetical protein